MNYNAKRLMNKFKNMNTNKNSYLSLQEAINAAMRSGSKLGQTNRNRFVKANIAAPFGKLNMQEYQRMAKMKRGMATVNSLRKGYNSKPVSIPMPMPQASNGPKKLSKNKFVFSTKPSPSVPSYNYARNGAMIKASHNKTLANANKNAAARRANLRSREANLKRSRNLYSGGKVHNRAAKFNFQSYLNPVYNTSPKNMPKLGQSVKNRARMFT